MRKHPVLSSFAPLVLRLALGVIFILHGYMKFADLVKTVHFFASLGIPLPAIVAPGIALLEIVGGIALILGLVTRLFALLLMIDMIFAIFTAKAQAGFVGGWEFELMLIAGLFALVLSGPGILYLVLHKEVAAREDREKRREPAI